MILDNEGKIYTFGTNLGQLGLGDYINKNVPTLINDIDKIIDISACGYHSMILSKNVLIFGSNNLGQLGLGDNSDRNIPTLLKINL